MSQQTMTQRQQIIEYCEKNGFITNRDATTKLFINSPTKRISEIRKSGFYDVDTEDVWLTDEEGRKTTHFFRYRIIPLEPGDALPYR